MAHKINPPFRVDHVGSFLRPQELLEARRQAQLGALTEAQLREVEDKYIAELVKKQQETGIKSVTDGEFRRAFYHLDFLKKLDGITVDGTVKLQWSEQNITVPTFSVTGKLGISKSVELDNFNYIKSLVDPTTGAVPKITIPSPTMVHFLGGRESIDITAYPELGPLFDDIARVYRTEIDTLYKAGCRYIQLDDTNLASLCDANLRAAAAQRHGGVHALPRQYAKLINACIDGRPDDLCIATHLCRGNLQSQWFAQGGYEPIAEVLFNELNVDAYFLEWESDRAGDFKPLRFLPKGKVVVLGLISSKVSTLEVKEDIVKRIREAAQYAPLDQLALSPQCGFSSTEEGNAITYESQWEKMKLVIDIAKEVWGDR
ncbi:UROD/MetE-like protein [Fistulina hepatica ATCC 64428]|nr:UROD/MetE-like protein [Fistulina hepatica ATCC 64428]